MITNKRYRLASVWLHGINYVPTEVISHEIDSRRLLGDHLLHDRIGYVFGVVGNSHYQFVVGLLSQILDDPGEGKFLRLVLDNTLLVSVIPEVLGLAQV